MIPMKDSSLGAYLCGDEKKNNLLPSSPPPHDKGHAQLYRVCASYARYASFFGCVLLPLPPFVDH